MTSQIRIREYPVFAKGTFRRYPNLFNRFSQNAADHLMKKYELAWQSMPRYEEAITWSLLSGPGFCGATHPGADNVFVEIMVGITSYVYNSDCLYVNPAKRVFAISDPPGITEASRRLFVALDDYLKHYPPDRLEFIINELNQKMRPEAGATLSLVYLPAAQPGQAVLFVAGDTLLFHGNLRTRTLKQVTGMHDFIGTPYARFESQAVALVPDDFFLIASDGVYSIKNGHHQMKLEEALLQYLNGEPEDIIYRAMNASNRYYEETINNSPFARFGGNDNVSLLMVYPERLATPESAESFILGGVIESRD